VADPDVDPIPLPKSFRGADYQSIFLVDNPADIVGNPSGGIGRVRASLENDNLQVGTPTSGLRRRTHSRGISADDDKFFFSHGLLSSGKTGMVDP
jgi:hypothetical protein